jgi:hypothetical protein
LKPAYVALGITLEATRHFIMSVNAQFAVVVLERKNEEKEAQESRSGHVRLTAIRGGRA